MVFSLGEDGRYTQEFAVDYQNIENSIQAVATDIKFLDWASCFDWNGDTLIMADRVRYVNEGFQSADTCDFYVAAVDETGLVYYGKYDSSLTTSDVSYEGCQLGKTNKDSVHIYWSK